MCILFEQRTGSTSLGVELDTSSSHTVAHTHTHTVTHAHTVTNTHTLHSGNFFIEVTGLKPGKQYTYKYVVDGNWTVDPTAPKVCGCVCLCLCVSCMRTRALAHSCLSV